MKYLIYNTRTLYIEKRFETERGAKVSLSRKYSKQRDGHELAVTDLDTFHNEIDYDVQVRNIVGGKMVTIKKSEQGSCCDPSRELYHTM